MSQTWTLLIWIAQAVFDLCAWVLLAWLFVTGRYQARHDHATAAPPSQDGHTWRIRRPGG